ncbi:MAG: DNA-binding protein [Candidatus Parvarchaeota archaeon]|jgi:programmed cell death protein 5|nr:DNA-binding protein [Candidatus Parvarchaeota archaeon]
MQQLDQNSLEEKRKLEALKQEIMSKFLTKEARERLSNLKYAHPDIEEQVESVIIQSALSNRLKSVIDDDKLKELLASFSPEKKETKINFSEK